MLKKNLEYGYNAVLIFIFTFANLLILSSILFFIKIPISAFHLPISFITAIVEIYFLRKMRVRDFIIILVHYLI